MHSFFTRVLFAVLFALLLAGCGGSSSNKNRVAVVNLNPQSLSIVSGQVTQLSVSAVNSANTGVTTTFTFNSSNPALITVSPSGLVCGGVWDSTFVTCNGNDAQGNALTGSAVITATAAGVTSGPVNVAVHPSVTSIQIGNVPTSGTCFSNGQTQQFTAKAFHNGQDITSSIGQFSWNSTDGAVVSVDQNGLATANAPGAAQIIAGAGSVTSQGIVFSSCMPKQITVHLASDPAGGPLTESAGMNPADTLALETAMTDTNGNFISPAPVTLSSNNAAVATVSGLTLTAASPGGAGIVASCAPPRCGNGVGTFVYSNVFTVVVNGGSPATTVYAGTTTIPAAGTSPAIVPIDTSKSPPVAGTAITLPGAPTSIGFSRDGLKGWIDTSSGLLSLDPNSNTVTLVDADPIGVILAVSPDGTKVIISNVKFQTDVPSQRLFIFDSAANSLTTFIKPGAIAAAFTSDGSKAYIAANNGNVYVYSPSLTLRTLALGGSPSSVASIAGGPINYVADGAALKTINTCDNSFGSDLATTSAPQLVGSVANSNTLISVNQTGFDAIFANIPDQTVSQCPSPVSYATQFHDFGVGAFTARKLLVGSQGAHIAVLPVGINKILTGDPFGGIQPIGLAPGATEALAGDMTQDGQTVWVGVAGTNNVDRVDMNGTGDNFQLNLNLNKTNAPPDIIAVRPK